MPEAEPNTERSRVPIAEPPAKPKSVGLADRAMILVALDAAVLLVTLVAVLPPLHHDPVAWPTLALFVTANLAFNYVSGVYTTLFLIWRTRLFAALLASSAMATSAIVAATFFAPAVFVFGRKAALMMPALLPIAMFAVRVIAERFLRLHIRPRRVVVVGEGARAREIAGLIAEHSVWALAVIGHISTGDTHGDAPADSDAIATADLGPALGAIADLPAICAALRPDMVVVAGDAEPDTHRQAVLLSALRFCPRILTATAFIIHFARRVPVDQVSAMQVITEVGMSWNPYYETVKRFADILVALPGIALALAVLPVVAVGNLTSGIGWPLYMQRRVGRHGREFFIAKFRTMPGDAEAHGPRWAEPGDSRAPWFGRLMRRFHIDELPQFFNIFIGDMSVVGPRPERTDFHPALESQIPFFQERLLVRPGLTGWAQVNFRYGCSVADTKAKLEYDLYYVKCRGPLLDMAIVLRTIGVVLGGRSFPAVPRQFVAVAAIVGAPMPGGLASPSSPVAPLPAASRRFPAALP